MRTLNTFAARNIDMRILASAFALALVFTLISVPAYAQTTFSCHVWGKANFAGEVTVTGGGEERKAQIQPDGFYRAKFEDKLLNCNGFTFTAVSGEFSNSGVWQEPSLRLDLTDPSKPISIECNSGFHVEDGQCVADAQPEPEPTPTDDGSTQDGIVIGGTVVAVGSLAAWLISLRRSKTGSNDSELDKVLIEIAKTAKPRIGVRITFYKDTDGRRKYKLAHYHPGIVGYHDPGTEHRDKNLHEKGKVIVEGD